MERAAEGNKTKEKPRMIYVKEIIPNRGQKVGKDESLSVRGSVFILDYQLGARGRSHSVRRIMSRRS